MQVNYYRSGDHESENPNSNQAHSGSMSKLILFNNIRLKLLDQLCFLDVKAESHCYLVNELSKFFRHRGFVESEHCRGLDKILHSFQSSPGTSSKNSIQLPSQNAYMCWNVLMKETSAISCDYNSLFELYNVNVMLKLQKILQIYKKYYELISETHDEILRILRNFYTTINTYTIYQKNNSSSSDKLDLFKSRNIYKHLTATSNVDIHKNMLRDLKDIIDAMDLGFGLMISKAILAHVTLDHKLFKLKLLSRSEADLTQTNAKLQHQSNKETNDDSIERLLHLEFELQTQLLNSKEKKLRKNLEVIYGILESLEAKTENLLEPERKSFYKASAPQADVPPKISASKSLSNSSLSTVIKQIAFKTNSNPTTSDSKAKSIPANGRPRLFGGSLEEYIKLTNEPIPLIMRSCIRVISTYGLQSQGIFRVSGSQIEIMNFRECFERGEDPLAGATDAADMNSVAGVLKLYLRELQEPLFPSKYFNFFISLKQMDSEHEVVAEMRNFFRTISKPIVIVIRFLFSFLNHLSEYARENMMDAFNLAISFGPTLMPTPEDRKQVQYQTQLNELIKIIIINHHDIFPKDLGGPRYQKRKTENYFSDSSNNAAES